jgi:DNA-binding transcriptional ArsR family regulator
MRSPAPALLPIFRSALQAELLTTLFAHPDQAFSLSEIARRLSVALPTLHREVNRLVEAGLVTEQASGRQRLLRANTEHPAARPLTQLLEITFGARRVIDEEFDIPGADQVLIFGSWAARLLGVAGPPPNDVDVLILSDTVDRVDAYEAADRAQERLGLPVNPVIRTWVEWNDPADQLCVQIKASPHVMLDGRPMGTSS